MYLENVCNSRIVDVNVQPQVSVVALEPSLITSLTSCFQDNKLNKIRTAFLIFSKYFVSSSPMGSHYVYIAMSETN